MASRRERVRKDGTVSYEVLFRHGKRQKSETFNNLRAQQSFYTNVERLGADKALEILQHREDGQQDIPTLGEQMVEHIDSLSGVTEGTLKTYRRIAADIEQRAIGALPVDALTDTDIAAWVRARRKEGRAGKTIRNEHALISAALTRAQRKGHVSDNVARGVKIPRTITEEMVILLPDEFQILYDRIPVESKVERAFVRLLYGTGMRFGEAAALRLGDHRKAETPPTVSIVRAWQRTGGKPVLGVPKTRMGRRTVSLPWEVHDDLLDLGKGRAANEYIFTDTAGRPLTHQRVWELWQVWSDDKNYPDGPKIGKKAGMHDLRHSHASWMIGKGMNMLDLQHRLGHESIETTAGTYGHLLPESLAIAARIANSMFVTGARAEVCTSCGQSLVPAAPRPQVEGETPPAVAPTPSQLGPAA